MDERDLLTQLEKWLPEANKIVDGGNLKIYSTGKKYIKLATGTSVYAFVDKRNGDLLFPASWHVPTKSKPIRGNIFKGTDGVEKFTLKYLRN